MAQPQQRERRENRRDPELSEFSNDYLEQLPANKAEFLERHAEWIAQNHKGIAPEGKVTSWGGTPESETRKEVCEDAALKMPEKGLYVVADGVSSEGGWFASRVATEHLGKTLGEDFDKLLDNLASTISPDGRTEGKQTVEQVTEEIRRIIDTSIRDCDKLIKKCAEENTTQYGLRSGSTLALGKLVDLPDGEGGHLQRFFYATLGDSPIYVQRKNGRVEKIIREDSLINMRLEAGQITEQDVETIQLARDEYELPRHLRDTYKKAQVITQSLGISGLYTQDGEMRGGLKEDLVHYVDLRPGDRVILASDGFSDQFTETDIDGMMAMTEGDDAAADDLMQERALDSSRKGRRHNPRAKRDDIAAMSFTAQERGPSREYLKQGKEGGAERVSVEELRTKLEALTGQLEVARTELQRLQTEGRGLLPLNERLPAEMAVLDVEKQIEQTRYDIERAGLDKFDQEIPPRFKGGEVVRLMSRTEQGRVPHPNQWRVSGFDDTRSEYILQDEHGRQFSMNRYQLELDQGTIRPQRGDTIPYYMEGMTENGFTVSAVDLRTGSVRVEKDKGQMVREGQMDRDMVQHAYQSRLMNAMRAKGRMDSYAAAFHRVNNEIGERKTQLQQVEEMEARNAVRMRFKERVTEREQQVQQLRQELEQMRAENEALQADLIDELKTIEKMKDTLAEYQEMERLDRDGRLHKDKQNRFRSLKLAVYPTRNYPGISESLIEQAEAAYQEELEGYNARAQAYNEKAATYQQLRRKVITNQES